MNTYYRVNSSSAITEHAQLYAGGSMLVRPNDPECERVWPTSEWSQAMTKLGGRVFRRTIIVVSDWEEVHAS